MTVKPVVNRTKKMTQASRAAPRSLAEGGPSSPAPSGGSSRKAKLVAVSPEPGDEATTPLSRTLRAQSKAARVTPLDLFALSRSKYLAGERLDIGRLAKELGVGRATLFRWVGSREQLYGEILSAAYAQEVERARRKIQGTGAEVVAQVAQHTLGRLVHYEPLRRFVAQDSEFAIRVLTSNSSPVHRRCVSIQRALLAELEQAGEIEPELDIDTLAFVIVRIGEAFLYADTGPAERESGIKKAVAAIRILVDARRKPQSEGHDRE